MHPNKAKAKNNAKLASIKAAKLQTKFIKQAEKFGRLSKEYDFINKILDSHPDEGVDELDPFYNDINQHVEATLEFLKIEDIKAQAGLVRVDMICDSASTVTHSTTSGTVIYNPVIAEKLNSEYQQMFPVTTNESDWERYHARFTHLEPRFGRYYE